MTYEAFLAEILAHPEEDAPRLIFADWLTERGDPRGEYIRCAIAVARWVKTPSNRPGGTQADGANAGACLAREQELLEAHCRAWFGVSLWPNGKWRDVAWDSVSYEFRRGFPEVVECSAEAWFTHADALTKAAPLTTVRLTTSLSLIARYFRKNDESRFGFITNSGGLEMPAKMVRKGRLETLASRVVLLDEALAVEWPHIDFHLLEHAHAHLGVSQISFGGVVLGEGEVAPPTPSTLDDIQAVAELARMNSYPITDEPTEPRPD